MCELDPRVSVGIGHQSDLLGNQSSISNRNSLIPSLVVKLSKCAGATDKLTSGPLSELAEVPCEISSCEIFGRVLKRS